MIGIFDSGVGGMTVARALEQSLPDYRLIYFGDLARSPYGSKSPETIRRYALDDTEFLLSQGAKLIVIACNSAASVASDLLKEKYSVPIFEVISPAVARACNSSPDGRIGVIGTRATIRSGIYEQQLKATRPAVQVFSQPCPLLVPLVEEGWQHKQETKMILRRYLQPLKARQVDTLVLGCTHYPLLTDLIKPRMGRRTRIIDSSTEMAAQVKSYLENNPEFAQSLARSGENVYYVSDITLAAEATARRIFERPIDLIRTAS